MSNFNFLKEDKRFESFADIALNSEKLIDIDLATCVLNCRKAMEIAVKWMYSVDGGLTMPYRQELVNLISSDEFKKLVNEDILKRIDFIRKTGNLAAHSNKKISFEMALLCLENLYYFFDFIACCYSDYDGGKEFDKSCYTEPLLKDMSLDPEIMGIDGDEGLSLDELIEKNKYVKEELTKKREIKQLTYVPKPLSLSEYKTRKLYIDTMLKDAGWVEGADWINEVELKGMANKSQVGYADYVLYDDTHKPLAVIEAKKTCKDVAVGRIQANLYADLLEEKYSRRPVIFLTNGFETRIQDGRHPERKVAAIYSKRDLEKFFNLNLMRTSLKYVKVDENIAGRYYQKGAIKAVCEDFDKKNRRKSLLVMATGSGKTRTVIALCDVLLKHGWVKNILFLADRTSLVRQAKSNFTNLLPNLSAANLCEDKDNYTAHCIFSTYQTMMHCIDSVLDEGKKLYTPGHFDLVICDEAHRSIYNKYRDIFTYFDAPLVGLTATPKDEIDKNTYEIFNLENGVPTYGYELAQAVKDGYLVDYKSIETKLKFLTEGIVYDDLSDKDKEEYENKFTDENGDLPEAIESSALNTWLFNKNTIREVLSIVMEHGIKIDYGSKIGKTIIFAKNHKHAERIYKIFNEEYPHLNGYAEVIDNTINYVQHAIDEFSDPKKLPQIAISVDMLDTGIDVPEALNLVFFKKVMSKAKFWQMIGRGTRLCKGLLDGNDKDCFYIFDFCGNFEFFRVNKNGNPIPNMIPLSGAIFGLKAQLAYKLQDLAYQTEDLIKFRKSLVDDMVMKVQVLNKENFAVHQHIKYVELYSVADNYNALTYEDTLLIYDELCPLITPDDGDAKALRFDHLLYGIELAYLIGKTYKRARNDLLKKVRAIASIATNIPEIDKKKDLINDILHTNYLDNSGINEFEHIRKELRDLMKFLPSGQDPYDISITDKILSMEWNDSELDNDDLQNYKAKVEFCIRQKQDSGVIKKLKTNVPLTSSDIDALEEILWNEAGTKEEYEAEYGQKPLGELVREIVGMDMNAAKEAFSQYLNDTSLNSTQIYFINQIVEYIVHNGIMKDLSVLQEPPFTDNGSIIEIFTDLTVWAGLRKVIESINANATAA